MRAVLEEAARRLLERAGSMRAARLEAEVLLASVLGRGRAALLGLADVQSESVARLAALVEERARTARPVAYLVGRRDFWDLSLTVDERCLVPRPETELLVETVEALARRGELPEGPIIDRGTGSGAVGLALAGGVGERLVVGSERSSGALEVAAMNARATGRRLALVQADGLLSFGRRRVAAVVANPPYVAAEDWSALPADVRDHEPREALVPDEGSVEDLFARLAAEAAEVLVPGGWLVTEVGAGQADLVDARLAASGFTAVDRRLDLAGIERVVLGRRA